MSESTYNGWTNYETWAVKLWLDNSQGDQEYAAELCTKAQNEFNAADDLRAFVEESMPDLGASMASDLLSSALGRVNWREIAESYREKVDEA
jgi:hypothetical protein